jgi:hypothetical protein
MIRHDRLIITKSAKKRDWAGLRSKDSAYFGQNRQLAAWRRGAGFVRRQRFARRNVTKCLDDVSARFHEPAIGVCMATGHAPGLFAHGGDLFNGDGPRGGLDHGVTATFR